MKQKKIVLINQYCAQAEFSGEHRYPDWGQYLTKEGYDVTIIGAPDNNSPAIKCNGGYINGRCIAIEKGVKYIYLELPEYQGNGLARIKNMTAFYFEARKALKEQGEIDVIVARTPNPFACIASILYCKTHATKNITDVVDLWPESIKVYFGKNENKLWLKALYLGEKWIYKNSKAIIFSMAGGFDYIKEKCWQNKIPKEKVFHINMGVNLDVFDSCAHNEKYEDEHLENKKLFKVAYTGSVSMVNDLKILCDAGSIIQAKGINDVFIMIHGAGTQVEELREYCKENNINNVKLYGRVEKKHIPYILTHSDLCFLCYKNTPLLRFGGSMSKMFEYLASGKPVITNAKMGYSLIQDKGCGCELNSNNPNDVAEAILKIKNMSVSERKSMGKNSRKIAEEYDIKNMCKTLLEVVRYVEEL